MKRMNTILRVLAMSAIAVATVTATAKEKTDVNTIKTTISDKSIVYPESFETDTKAMMNNWYLKNYTVLDSYVDNTENVKVSDEVYIKRLQAMPTTIEMPFNSVVKNYIEMYVNRRRTLVEEMLGMSLYYMPIFEDALERQGLPLELKYLPVIESAINPDAVSRVGAAGLWQFMVSTAKGLGLEVNSLVDERRDPYRSSEKAAEYLKNLYNIYHDWSLAIAAYNCGPGKVNQALRRAGAAEGEMRDFWEIYEYLPRETRGYVPAFIAANYVMTYFKNHNISPSLAKKPLLTDRVRVTDRIAFKQISDVLNIPIDELRVLNPQFRRDVIPGNNHPYDLCLPMHQVGSFIMSEDSIKGYTNGVTFPRATVEPGVARNDEINGVEGVDFKYETRTVTKWHKVRRGETLAKIASAYGVTTSSIKKDNGLRSSSVKRGKSLKIVTTERVKVPIENDEVPSDELLAQDGEGMQQEESAESVLEEPVAVAAPKTPSQPASNKHDGIVVKHTVVAGETLHTLAKANGLTVDQLKTANRLSDDNIQVGMVLTIPDPSYRPTPHASAGTQSTATTTSRPAVHASEVHKPATANNGDAPKQVQHVVKRGETLARIARNYGVTIDDIKALNDIENDVVQRGQLIMIPVLDKKNQAADEATAEPKQAEKADTPSQAQPTTYKVRKGDTLGKIADRFGTTIDAIMQANDMKDTEIMVGETLKLTGTDKGESAKRKSSGSTTTYKVRSGDTLGSIASRYGTTVNAIKRASGLKSDRLSVGQRLTIPTK
ncbi:MAG: LysM peptidoglycan-binding domain-containing protein [Muribaculaceae bacterium]